MFFSHAVDGVWCSVSYSSHEIFSMVVGAGRETCARRSPVADGAFYILAE